MGLLNNIKNAINPSKIDDFSATISKHSGLSKANRFAVIFSPPAQTLLNLDVQEITRSIFSGQFGLNDLINDPRDIAILCESVQIPGRRISSIDYGSNQDWYTSKIPQGFINDEVNMTFLLTNDYYMRKIFDRWMDSIVSNNDYLISYEKDYYTDVTIQALDNNNFPVYGVKLKNAYPLGVNSMSLDNLANDTISKLTVSFAFENFLPEGSIKSLLGGISKQASILRRLF